jgi:hypothetical protein
MLHCALAGKNSFEMFGLWLAMAKASNTQIALVWRIDKVDQEFDYRKRAETLLIDIYENK